MKRIRMILVLLGLSVGAIFVVGGNGDGDKTVVIRDDCDPDDPAWDPTGGCARDDGDVTFAEFGVELESTLAPTSVIGHQAWRNDPPYLKIEEGETVRIRNRGGRAHTFTEVDNFGGGKIGPPFVGLNKGLATASECPTSADMPPGGSQRVEDLPRAITASSAASIPGCARS